MNWPVGAPPTRRARIAQRFQRTLDGVVGDLGPSGALLAPYACAGKHLRGRLALLPAAEIPEGDEERAVRFATFVELIHAGTLCHDDVVDRSVRRRDRPAIGATAGSTVAGIGGLLLMWRGNGFVAGEGSHVRERVAVAASRVAEGQMEEMADLWLEVPVDRYVQRQRAKTAALFELAAWLGAEAAGLAPETADAMVRMAGHAGLAFQIADDMRDIVGPATLGREPGTDLREGVLTLPVLLTFAGDSRADELRDALRLLRRSGYPAVQRRCRQLLLTNASMQRSRAILDDVWTSAMDELRNIHPEGLRAALRGFVEDVRAKLEEGTLGWTSAST